MNKNEVCMADGGTVGADGLTDAQRAKLSGARSSLGVSESAPAPTAAPAPVQQAAAPAPAPAERERGIFGLLKGRSAQIDKASGYARGGIVRGKGGVDNVPMAIGGVDVNLTGGKKPEAVLPGKTVEALGGPAAVEAVIEATNGKPPVKDGLKAGGNYADGLVINEEDPRLKPFGPTVPALGSGIFGISKAVASTGVPAPATFTNGRDATGTITADSAQSLAAAPMQRSGGVAGSIDMAGVNGILARENKARGEMIDLMVKANGGNGIAIMPEAPAPAAQSGISDIQSAMKSAGTRTERAAYGQAMNTALNNQVQQRGQDLSQSVAMAGHGITARGQDLNNERAAGHDQVLMRGQDINAASDAARTGILRTTKEEELGQKKAASDAGVSLYLENNPNATKPQLDAVRSGIIKAAPESDKSAPAEVKLAGAFVAAGLAKNQADGLRMATQSKSDSPEKIRAEVYGKALVANMGNAAAAEKATDGAMKYLFPPAEAQAVPPSDKREIGKTYDTPKGKLVWRGNGWEAAQ